MSDNREGAKPMTDRQPCSATLIGTGWGTRAPCQRTAKVERDGKWYCGQHDPDVKKARRAANLERWEREQRITKAARAIELAREEAADLVERGDVSEAELAAARAKIMAAHRAHDALVNPAAPTERRTPDA